MNNYTETIRENYKKVYDLRNTAAGAMREFYVLPYLEQRAAINANRNLSDEGKQRKLSELTQKLEDDIMQFASDMQRVKDEALENANKAAQQMLIQPLEKVDDVTQEIFNEKMREVQASVTFATNAKSAIEALGTVLDTQEPILAKEAAEVIQSLAREVIAIANEDEKQQVKQQLGRIHSELYERGLPQGAQEAKETLEAVKSMRQSSLMPQIVVDYLGSYSKTLKEYVNKPYNYRK
ncbi:hypothetical protein [Bacillus alkalicellulosilyticus]|uniref:hypothetical protein n=1 Tax=Alkalihalobacterium alkalicellulosilyticum TaxID=1912214 RepID=UPI000998E113|nr:hypothetical protein [Bacillus alkalicellulosilyticus]